MRYKEITLLLMVMVLSYALPVITKDWRITIIVGIISGIFLTQRLKSFIIGFTGSLIAWLSSTLYVLLSPQNQRLLSLISEIAGIPSILLLVIFILVPSLITGLSSLIATLIRNLIMEVY